MGDEDCGRIWYCCCPLYCCGCHTPVGDGGCRFAAIEIPAFAGMVQWGDGGLLVDFGDGVGDN